MNQIDMQIAKIKQEGRLGLMMHVVVGYPSIDKTVFIVKKMAKFGADFVELQIPFSDPLADGPTIMKACEAALEKGTKVKDAFKIARILSREVRVPLLFMAYFNNVYKYGTEKFCKDAKSAGVSGLIVPDISLEEEDCENFMKYCDKYGLCHIKVLSPASTTTRLKLNSKVANGFVYCTARQGITGLQEKLDVNIIKYFKRVKRYLNVPIAVGFGISKREHVGQVRHYADIVVVGSAVIEIINSYSQKKDLEREIRGFLKSLKV